MTRRRLGGWLRLWISLCGIYGAIVATIAVSDMPSQAPQPSDEKFLHSLSDESLKVLYRVPGISFDDLPQREQLEALRRVDKLVEAERIGTLPPDKAQLLQEARSRGILPIHPAELSWKSAPIVRRTPNSDGWEITLPADVTKAEEDRINGEVANMMATSVVEVRWSHMRSAAMWWLIPCVLVLCVGLTIRWVYRGFRGAQT